MSSLVGPTSTGTDTGISPGVRHDLQHVLATLQAVLSVADSADTLPPEELREFVRTARSEAVHALAVLDSLPAQDPGDPPACGAAAGTDADVVLRGVARTAVSTGCAVTVRSRPRLFVPMSQTALTRVVRNLLTNALAASGPEGAVELHARRIEGVPGGRPAPIRIEVHDDGPGFPDDGVHRIGGQGLGVVRSLVLSAGGWLVLGRSPLGGACAVVTLPGQYREGAA
ncbi:MULTISPECIES: sensor histidine kinase [unclassified Blastococcus]